LISCATKEKTVYVVPKQGVTAAQQVEAAQKQQAQQKTKQDLATDPTWRGLMNDIKNPP
jgi:hypothetical protein